MAAKILLVEDSQSLRESLSMFLKTIGHQAVEADSSEKAIDELAHNEFDLVLSDFKLPGQNGLDLLKYFRSIHPSTPFVLMTAYGSIDIAVEAMKFGANDFITKPLDPDALENTLSQLLVHKQILNRPQTSRANKSGNIITKNQRMIELLSQAERVARVDSPVLILGESGTGKELFAQHIHKHSSRATKPFVAVNCGALPATLLESELFGHARGAYTGATQERVGLMEYASEGTLFLDEVGEMPPQLQVKLLRALQEGEIRPLGSSETKKVNPRIISATHRDIPAMLSSASLREDFYYRINVLSFELPPLRERPEDIPYLVQTFLHSQSARLGITPRRLSQEAEDLLSTYQWPGNVRELEHACERALLLSDSTLEVSHFGILASQLAALMITESTSLIEAGKKAAEQTERQLLQAAMFRSKGNKRAAAEMLHVSYKTLLHKLKEYGIENETSVHLHHRHA
jgi:two-component system, NtrC family, response regulator AtoC